MLSPSSSSTNRKRTYSQGSNNDTTFSTSEKKLQHLLKDSKKIIIIVQSYMENAAFFTLIVDPLDSVKKVKELIEDKKLILAFNYNLVFNGKQLEEEDKPISEFGIKNESFIQMLPNESQYIQLPVLNNAGKTTVIKTNVKETIEDLQVKIQNQTGIPLVQQRFTCFDANQAQESLSVVEEREIPFLNVVAASSNESKPEMITIVLRLLTHPEFRHIFKMKYTDRFDKVYLDYGVKAGYDKPEDLNLLWDDGIDYLNIKYFDTPQKLGMPLNATVTLLFNPKPGAKREASEDETHDVSTLDMSDLVNLSYQKKLCTKFSQKVDEAIPRFLMTIVIAFLEVAIAKALSKALCFNTFGGNPLASVVGKAVLEIRIFSLKILNKKFILMVIEEEKLQENCQKVGTISFN
uniref:Ubiquitin-like domain-containing protein n=1 Tax=Panagrolaimus davidi TaxID=227884 RepID=A0A914PVM5_9BILA